MRRILAAVAVIVIMSGCASEAPKPAPTSTPVPSSTPVSNVASPHPFLDLTCADLVPSSVVDATTDDTITARPVAIVRELSWFDQPRGAAVRQLGGFTCEWSNGAPEIDDSPNPDYSGIYVSVLPDATDEWPKYSAYTNGELSTAQCGTDDYAQTCTFDALDGTTWVHVELRGARATDPAGAQDAVVASVRTALASGSAGAPWTPATDTLPIDLSCEALEPTLDDYFGRPNDAVDENSGGWSQEASSWSIAGILDKTCSYSYTTPDYYASSIYIQFYSGADWALHEALDSGLLGTATQFTTSSMVDTDGGWIICTDATTCTLHVAVAHGWVSAKLQLEPEDSAVAVDEMLRALAEDITEQVR